MVLERIRLCPSWCCRPSPFSVCVRRSRPAGSPSPAFARQPHQVADALESEHRVIDIEWHQVTAMGCVGGARRHKRGHRARLGDSLFKNLPVLGFIIEEQRLPIDGLVKLPLRRVDADLAKQRVQAKRAGLIGNNGHDLPAELLLRSSKLRRRTRPIVVDISNLPEPFNSSANASNFGTASGFALTTRRGRNPPSFWRRLSRYFVSRLSGAGR